ncbi:hypothetical protein ANO11243_045360 [Dothideomycetidae sp. 11243]|nr:hypothetical protein ANO11243_045360 [fungal sp. No.11243]
MPVTNATINRLINLIRPANRALSLASHPSSIYTSPSSPKPVKMAEKLSSIPPKTSIFYKSSSLRKQSSLVYVGPTKDSPLYAMTMHLAWSGRSDLTLHDGTDESAPPLAVAQSKSLMSVDSMFTLHTAEGREITEKLDATMHLTTERYGFALDVGGTMPERFEWRISKGEEVAALQGWKYGLKLVRLDGQVAEGEKRGSSSDGHEVVAAWAEPSINMANEIGRFELLGSAARGELGPYFAATALITAVRIWQVRWYIISASH